MTTGLGTFTLRIRVPPEKAGRRLDQFLVDHLDRLSRARVQRLLDAGGHRVSRADGTKLRASSLLVAGEELVVVRPRVAEPDAPLDFGVIHEDDALLVVDKPAGLPTHPAGRYYKHTLTSLLRERYGAGYARNCHRLDRETSGLVVCAKTRDAEVIVKMQFERREVRKTYVALVHGAPREDAFRIDLPIVHARSRGPLPNRVEVRDEGLPSVTDVKVLRRGERFSLVEARPLTGRQHQIRVHLAAAGHPVVGDKLYPDARALVDFQRDGLTPALLARLVLPRQALHAARIELRHPTSRERVTYEAPLPGDFFDPMAAR